MAVNDEREEGSPPSAPAAPPSERKGAPARRRAPDGDTSQADRYNAWAFAGTLAGWVLLLLGERVLTGFEGLSKLCTGLSVILLLGAFGQRAWAVVDAPAERRASTRAFAALSAVGLAALVLYGTTTDWGRETFGIDEPRFGEPDTYGDVVTVVWIALLVISVVPTVLGELARQSMLRADRVESRRVITAVVAGLSVAFAVVYGSLFTYGTGEVDWSADFSFFRVAAPSESTIARLRSLQEPLKVRVYFPSHSEVLQKVEKYLEDLQAKTGRLEIAVHDRLLVPDLAEEDEVRKDGVIVLQYGEKTEKLPLGVDEQKAGNKLRTLDGEFQTTLIKATREKRTAYLTVGHGELNEGNERGSRRAAKLLKDFIVSQNYGLKDLGLKEGLAREVPEDAGMVMVLGPTEPFSAAEVESLERYAEGGGSLFLALDPDGQVDLQPLAAIAGLDWRQALVMHDRKFYPIKRNPSDKKNIIAGRFSSHPSVSTLSKASAARGAAVLLPGASPLEKAEGADGYEIDFVVKAQPGAWIEQTDDFSFDSDAEKKGNVNVAAAVTRPVVPTDKGKPAPADAPEMRAFVLGDAHALSDFFLARVRTNPLLFAEAFRWLAGEESFTGTISEEKDVRIVHTKEEDQLWFYGAILGMPSILLGLGFFAHTRRRRTMGPKTTNEGDAPRPEPKRTGKGARSKAARRNEREAARRAERAEKAAATEKETSDVSEEASDEEGERRRSDPPADEEAGEEPSRSDEAPDGEEPDDDAPDSEEPKSDRRRA